MRDPDPALGLPDKWNSAAGAGGPHWLVIDFGQPRTIHRVVIRHEGVVGAFGGETKYNTADFQVQFADAAAGPWTDLVAPVVGNTASLTVHGFAPKNVRFLRVLITKGSAFDAQARIYEVQAFGKIVPRPKLLFVASDIPPLGYKTYYLTASDSKLTSPNAHAAGPDNCENQFYRIALAAGGVQATVHPPQASGRIGEYNVCDDRRGKQEADRYEDCLP